MKQTVCKVLNRFQQGKYLESYMAKQKRMECITFGIEVTVLL